MLPAVCGDPRVAPPFSLSGLVVASPPVRSANVHGEEIFCTEINEPGELAALVPAWELLSGLALEPNPFFEPWFLQPAFETLRSAGRDVRIIAVQARPRPNTKGKHILYGLFPIEIGRTMRGIPLRTARIWKHDFCFFGAPLVRRDCAQETLGAFIEWLAGAGCRLWHLPEIAAAGPFDVALSRTLRERGLLRVTRDRHFRAALVRRESGEAFMQDCVSHKRRHEVRRLARRLAEFGCVNTENWEGTDTPDWIEDFLRIEAEGWKGRVQSAMASKSGNRNFLETMLEGAASARSLQMSRLRFNGMSIAIKVNLLSGTGAYCFKIAYSEEFARFSPGVLLEVANIEQVHKESGCLWMDSCAEPGHSMIEHLWADRRCIESVVASTGLRGSNALAAATMLTRVPGLARRSRETRQVKAPLAKERVGES